MLLFKKKLERGQGGIIQKKCLAELLVLDSSQGFQVYSKSCVLLFVFKYKETILNLKGDN
jgi:hypothetical protein